MYILLVFLSLIGFLITGLFGRNIGPKGASIITTGCLIISFFLSIFACIGFFLFLTISNNDTEAYRELPDFELALKQIFIPEPLDSLRTSNKKAVDQLKTASSNLHSLNQQKLILQTELDTLNRLLVSDAYKLENPSRAQLLNKQIIVEQFYRDKMVENQPSLFRTTLMVMSVSILLQSIILLTLGWDKK